MIDKNALEHHTENSAPIIICKSHNKYNVFLYGMRRTRGAYSFLKTRLPASIRHSRQYAGFDFKVQFAGNLFVVEDFVLHCSNC